MGGVVVSIAEVLDMSRIGLGCANVMQADLPELIELASRHGFGTISGRPYTYVKALAEGHTEADLQARLADAGVVVGLLDGQSHSLPGARPLEPELLATLPPDLLDAPDEDTCLRAAVVLGAPVINVGTFFHDLVPVENMAEAVATLCRKAGERGLQVALEFIPYTGLPDLAHAQRVVEASGAPNCGLMLDVFHLDRTGGSSDDVRRLPAGAIAAIQISDRVPPAEEVHGPIERRRCMPGDGRVPLRELVGAALENSPDAHVEVEVLNEELSRLPADDVVAQLAVATRAWLATL